MPKADALRVIDLPILAESAADSVLVIRQSVTSPAEADINATVEGNFLSPRPGERYWGQYTHLARDISASDTQIALEDNILIADDLATLDVGSTTEIIRVQSYDGQDTDGYYLYTVERGFFSSGTISASRWKTRVARIYTFSSNAFIVARSGGSLPGLEFRKRNGASWQWRATLGDLGSVPGDEQTTYPHSLEWTTGIIGFAGDAIRVHAIAVRDEMKIAGVIYDSNDALPPEGNAILAGEIDGRPVWKRFGDYLPQDAYFYVASEGGWLNISSIMDTHLDNSGGKDGAIQRSQRFRRGITWGTEARGLAPYSQTDSEGHLWIITPAQNLIAHARYVIHLEGEETVAIFSERGNVSIDGQNVIVQQRDGETYFYNTDMLIARLDNNGNLFLHGAVHENAI